MKNALICLMTAFIFIAIGCVSNRTISVDDGKSTIEITGADQARRSALSSGYISDIKEDEQFDKLMVAYYENLKKQIGENDSIDGSLSEWGFTTAFCNETRDDLFIILERLKQTGGIRNSWQFDVPYRETYYGNFFPGEYLVYAYLKTGSGSRLHSTGKLRVWPIPIGEVDGKTVHGRSTIMDNR